MNTNMSMICDNFIGGGHSSDTWTGSFETEYKYIEWLFCRECGSKEDYHAYLTNYPNGKHRQAAEARLTDLLNATNANQLNLNKTTPERQDINNTNPNPRTPMSQPGMYRRGGPGPGAGRGPGSGPSRGPGQGPSRGPNRGTGSRHFR